MSGPQGTGNWAGHEEWQVTERQRPFIERGSLLLSSEELTHGVRRGPPPPPWSADEWNPLPIRLPSPALANPVPMRIFTVAAGRELGRQPAQCSLPEGTETSQRLNPCGFREPHCVWRQPEGALCPPASVVKVSALILAKS